MSGIALVLARRVTALSRDYADLQKRASLPHRGYVVPTLRAETLAGDSATIGEMPDSSGVRLVFVFTTTCPYCKATLGPTGSIPFRKSRPPSGSLRSDCLREQEAPAWHHSTVPVVRYAS